MKLGFIFFFPSFSAKELSTIYFIRLFIYKKNFIFIKYVNHLQYSFYYLPLIKKYEKKVSNSYMYKTLWKREQKNKQTFCKKKNKNKIKSILGISFICSHYINSLN